MKNYPNEIVQGVVDIKTAIENKSADTPVDIPDRDYPDELCEALGAVKTAIENSSGGGGDYDYGINLFDKTVRLFNTSGGSFSYTRVQYNGEYNQLMYVSGSLSNNQNSSSTDTTQYVLIDGAIEIQSQTNKEITCEQADNIEYIKIGINYKYRITPKPDATTVSIVITKNAHTYPENT